MTDPEVKQKIAEMGLRQIKILCLKQLTNTSYSYGYRIKACEVINQINKIFETIRMS